MFWIILVSSVVLDQLSKFLIVENMTLGQSIPIFGDFFQFTYTLNTGAGFSVLEGQRWFFVVLTILVFVAVLFLRRYIPRSYKRLHICIALFCGGMLGNFIDRLSQGAVVDFLHFNFFPAIFNIADSCLVVSVILICFFMIFGKEKSLLEEKEKKQQPAQLLELSADTPAVYKPRPTRYYRKYARSYPLKMSRNKRRHNYGIVIRYKK